MAELSVKPRKRVEASLCMNCCNARADRCGWVANFEPIWKRAEEKTIVLHDGGSKKRRKRVETVTVVRECEHYLGVPAKH